MDGSNARADTTSYPLGTENFSLIEPPRLKPKFHFASHASFFLGANGVTEYTWIVQTSYPFDRIQKNHAYSAETSRSIDVLWWIVLRCLISLERLAELQIIQWTMNCKNCGIDGDEKHLLIEQLQKAAGEKGNILDPRQDVNCIFGPKLLVHVLQQQERKLYLIASSATAKKLWQNQGLLTDASGSMTATMFENHAEEYFLVDGKTIMKYAAENDQNVVAIFPKLAIENEYRIQLKRREYPSHGVKVLAYNINNIKPALNEDNSKQNQPTNTGKAS